jgi:perosamine synthetase
MRKTHGARYDGKPVSSFSDIACFSFYGNKIVTTGEGGICLTDNPDLAARMRMLRDHGMRPERRYWHEEPGFNFRMTNLQAAIGCAQLEADGRAHYDAARPTLIKACREANIDLRPFFHGLSSMPAHRRFGRACPVSSALSASGVNLPTLPHCVDCSRTW